jgi:hypothetical protein
MSLSIWLNVLSLGPGSRITEQEGDT